MASKKNPLTDVLATKKATLKKVAEKPDATKDLPLAGSVLEDLPIDLPIPITDLPIPIPIDAKPETKVLAIKRATLKKVTEKTETKSDLPNQSLLNPLEAKPETKVLAMKKATLRKVAKKPEIPISKAKSANDLPSKYSKEMIDQTKFFPSSKWMLDPISMNLKDEDVITLAINHL